MIAELQSIFQLTSWQIYPQPLYEYRWFLPEVESRMQKLKDWKRVNDDRGRPMHKMGAFLYVKKKC